MRLFSQLETYYLNTAIRISLFFARWDGNIRRKLKVWFWKKLSAEEYGKPFKSWPKKMKIKKNYKKSKQFLYIIDWYNLAKFHVSSTCSCLPVNSNMFLRKSHFRENGHFLTHIGQKFEIFDSSWPCNYFLLIS